MHPRKYVVGRVGVFRDLDQRTVALIQRLHPNNLQASGHAKRLPNYLMDQENLHLLGPNIKCLFFTQRICLYMLYRFPVRTVSSATNTPVLTIPDATSHFSERLDTSQTQGGTL